MLLNKFYLFKFNTLKNSIFGGSLEESVVKQYFCQYACPHHQSNRLVACSANFVSLGGHALRGKSSTLSIDPLQDAKSSRCD